MRMGEIRTDCPCPKTKCERHKNCDACRAHHKKMPYCERGEKRNGNGKGAEIRAGTEEREQHGTGDQGCVQ